MEDISTGRASFLIPFVEALREIGSPVERELTRAKLPTLIEETPDERISNVLTSQFLGHSGRREGIEDIGWLGSSRYALSVVGDQLLAAISQGTTVKSRVDRLARLSKLEHSDASVGLIQLGTSAEIYCHRPMIDGLDSLQISEWAEVAILIELVRSVIGETWTPDQISFRSNFSVCNSAREAYPNTRFAKNAAHTSIVLPSSILARHTYSNPSTRSPERYRSSPADILTAYRCLLRPYLRGAAPKIELFAEIAGTSPRTLQRKLQQAGVSYSDLVATTRHEMATEMLEDPYVRLIDVALTLGFENQSNFGRSFRRFSGISPGKYRRQILPREHAA